MSHSSKGEETPKMPATGPQTKQEVLHQRRSLPAGPVRLALGGLAVVLTIGYFTLYSHKKPEATAVDVARVASGVASTPQNTHSTK